jgi:hypothetical protein
MSTLDINSIRDYLIKVGCKVEYPILVNAFKKHLCNPDPEIQGRVRTQFKDYVNRLSTVNVENNMKFITLRPEFRPNESHQHKEPAKQVLVDSRQHQPAVRQSPAPVKRTTSVLKQSNDQYHGIPKSENWRRWAIEACNCNYNNLLAMLRQDPKLAPCRDIVNGYTVLHWAAKFGNMDIIKLIAGAYGVSVNTKSNAGHTPLHVAYMFNRLEVAKLLLESYHADPNIRDHSGKKPMQYWQRPNNIRHG